MPILPLSPYIFLFFGAALMFAAPLTAAEVSHQGPSSQGSRQGTSILQRPVQPLSHMRTVDSHPRSLMPALQRALETNDVIPLTRLVDHHQRQQAAQRLNSVWGREERQVERDHIPLRNLVNQVRSYAMLLNRESGFRMLRNRLEISVMSLDREILRHQIRNLAAPIILMGIGETDSEALVRSAVLATDVANFLVDEARVLHPTRVDGSLASIRAALGLLDQDFWTREGFNSVDLDIVVRVTIDAFKRILDTHDIDAMALFRRLSSEWTPADDNGGVLAVTFQASDGKPLTWTWKTTRIRQSIYWRYELQSGIGTSLSEGGALGGWLTHVP